MSFPDEEKEKLEEIKAICDEFKDQDPEFENPIQCPCCSETLPFGHVTKKCENCQAALCFCFESLGLVQESDALRCQQCFSTFSLQLVEMD